MGLKLMKLILVLSVLVSAIAGSPYQDIGDRIIGGDDGDIADFPYILQLEYNNELVCGASLVSSNFALTAGNCVSGRYIEGFLLRAGSATLYEEVEEFSIENIIFHPQYYNRDNNYGVALLLLSRAVSIPGATPIELATDDDAITEGANLTVSGWGWMDFSYYTEFSPILQVIDLPILGDEQCSVAYDIVTDLMFCVGYLEGPGRGYCFGDAGGPAVIDGVLVGIMSSGSGCGDGVHAGVLVRASRVKEWVERVIKSPDV